MVRGKFWLWGAVGVWVATAAIVWSGCGGKAKGVSPGEQEVQPTEPWRLEPAQALTLKVFSAREDLPALPNAQAVVNDASGKWAISSGFEVLFKNPVNLQAAPQGLFLGWSDAAFERKIVNAFYIHKRLDPANTMDTDAERKSAGFDADSGLWFVPLRVDTLASTMPGDAADRHWLTLDLQLEDGSRILVYAGMQVLFPIADLKVEPATKPGVESDFAFKTPREGWPIHRRAYTSTGVEGARVWIRAGLQADFDTIIRHVHYQGFADRPPARRESLYASRIAMRLQLRLEIFDGQGNFVSRQNLYPDSEEWSSVVVKAGQKLFVEWRALPVPGVMQCGLPVGAVRVFHWDNIVDISIGKIKVPASKEVREEWQVAGAVLRWRTEREFRLTSPYTNYEEFQAQLPGLPVIDAESHQYNDSVGGVGSEVRPPLGCNGYF